MPILGPNRSGFKGSPSARRAAANRAGAQANRRALQKRYPGASIRKGPFGYEVSNVRAHTSHTSSGRLTRVRSFTRRIGRGFR